MCSDIGCGIVDERIVLFGGCIASLLCTVVVVSLACWKPWRPAELICVAAGPGGKDGLRPLLAGPGQPAQQHTQREAPAPNPTPKLRPSAGESPAHSNSSAAKREPPPAPCSQKGTPHGGPSSGVSKPAQRPHFEVGSRGPTATPAAAPKPSSPTQQSSSGSCAATHRDLSSALKPRGCEAAGAKEPVAAPGTRGEMPPLLNLGEEGGGAGTGVLDAPKLHPKPPPTPQQPAADDVGSVPWAGGRQRRSNTLVDLPSPDARRACAVPRKVSGSAQPPRLRSLSLPGSSVVVSPNRSGTATTTGLSLTPLRRGAPTPPSFDLGSQLFRLPDFSPAAGTRNLRPASSSEGLDARRRQPSFDLDSSLFAGGGGGGGGDGQDPPWQRQGGGREGHLRLPGNVASFDSEGTRPRRDPFAGGDDGESAEGDPFDWTRKDAPSRRSRNASFLGGTRPGDRAEDPIVVNGGAAYPRRSRDASRTEPVPPQGIEESLERSNPPALEWHPGEENFPASDTPHAQLRQTQGPPKRPGWIPQAPRRKSVTSIADSPRGSPLRVTRQPQGRATSRTVPDGGLPGGRGLTRGDAAAFYDEDGLPTSPTAAFYPQGEQLPVQDGARSSRPRSRRARSLVYSSPGRSMSRGRQPSVSAPRVLPDQRQQQQQQQQPNRRRHSNAAAPFDRVKGGLRQGAFSQPGMVVGSRRSSQPPPLEFSNPLARSHSDREVLARHF
ncbi:hypothetical protein DIPPA_24514 [Diplonema papillatum]|nr:hypothetical protein DIPPA_24514 [Diplonema papillatum]